MDSRRFDDSEVAEILKRAAEIQSGLPKSGSQTGLSGDDLVKVALEVGLDPDVVREAMAEQSQKTIVKKASPSTSQWEATIACDLSDETWEDIVSQLRAYVGRPGSSQENGATREWVAGRDIENIMLTAHKRGASTILRMNANTSGASILGWLMTLAFGLLTTLATVTSLAKHNPTVSVLLFLLLGLGMSSFFVLTNLGLTHLWRTRAQQRAAKLFDKVVQSVTKPQASHEVLVKQTIEEDVRTVLVQGSEVSP